MVEFNNPPQPVLTPIKNAVNYEERVSVLLNGSGSTYENPVVSSNYLNWPVTTVVSELLKTDVDSALADGNSKGAAVTVRFGLADSSETIGSAHIRTIDTDGNQTASTSIRSSFVKDTANNYFSADLFAGSDFPAGTSTEAQRSFVDITTNLGRSLRQQIYTQKAPDNTVLISGLASSSSSYAVVNPISLTQSLSSSNTFFPTWNDEIARQHGASDIGLTGLISKPYGGMQTVQIIKYSSSRLQYDVIAPEVDIRLASTLDYQAANSGEEAEFVYVFRSKKGSPHTVVFAVYLNYTLCGEVGTEDVPPIITDPDDPSGGGIFDEDNVIIDQEGFGVLEGVAATSSTITLTGYKGGVVNDSGATAVSDIPLGSFDTSVSSPGTKTITIAGTDLADASLIIAEVANSTDSTVKGNSLVYIRGNTDIGIPGVPDIPSAFPPTYAFGSETLHYTVDGLGWTGETVTVHIKPFYGIIKNTAGSAQGASDLGTGVGGAPKTLSVTSTGTYNTDLGVWTDGTPDAIEVSFSNTFGYSDVITYIKDPSFPSTIDQDVKKGPVITEGSTTFAGFTFNLTDAGNQPTGEDFQLIYYHYDDSASTITEVTGGTVTATTGSKSVSISLFASDEIIAHLVGDQGSSNTIKLTVGSFGG